MKINKKLTLIAALISVTSMNYGYGEYEGAILDSNFGIRRSTDSSRPTMSEHEEQQRAAELRAQNEKLEVEKRFANRTIQHYSPARDEQPIRLERPQDTRTTWKKIKDFFNDMFFDGRTVKKSIDNYTSKVLTTDTTQDPLFTKKEDNTENPEEQAFIRLSDKAQLKYINRFTDAINEARQKELTQDSQALIKLQTDLEAERKKLTKDISNARKKITTKLTESLKTITSEGSALRTSEQYKNLTQAMNDPKASLNSIKDRANEFLQIIQDSRNKTNFTSAVNFTERTVNPLDVRLKDLNQQGHEYNLARRKDKIEIEKKYNDKLDTFYTELNQLYKNLNKPVSGQEYKQIIYNTDTGKAEFYTEKADVSQFSEQPITQPEDRPISAEPTTLTSVNEEQQAQKLSKSETPYASYDHVATLLAKTPFSTNPHAQATTNPTYTAEKPDTQTTNELPKQTVQTTEPTYQPEPIPTPNKPKTNNPQETFGAVLSGFTSEAATEEPAATSVTSQAKDKDEQRRFADLYASGQDPFKGMNFNF